MNIRVYKASSLKPILILSSYLRLGICIYFFSMVLPTLSGPWPLIQLRNHFFHKLSQTVRLLGRGISSSQGVYLNTGQHKHRINAYTPNIHALSENWTHDPSVRTSEDSSCLRPRGYCDRQSYIYKPYILYYVLTFDAISNSWQAH
jgi:hypothetical protein